MLSINISNMVSVVVESELRGKGKEDQALYLNFDCRMSYYKEGGGEFNDSLGLHLLYWARPHSNYITVFSGLTRSPFGTLKGVKDWVHEASHDSCWRDIDIFSSVYFGMARRINSELVLKGYKEVAPKDMNEHNSIAGLGGNSLYRWVKVKVEAVDPTNSYKKKVTLLE